VQLVPGVELSCTYEGHDIHILAYAFDPLDERVEKRLRSFRATRAERGKRMVDKLAELGFKIDHARVEELSAGGAMGRPHVARALVENGYVKSVAEAFDKLIGAGKPAYVPKERFQIEEAVALIHSAGGLLSIAHPTLYQDHERVVTVLLDAGVDAIEVMHPDIDEANREMYTPQSPLGSAARCDPLRGVDDD
jgi:predicted metal-dependent phosphoesterase TrpH